MPVPVEAVVPGRCFRASDNAKRKVLLKQDERVTYILHADLAWTVHRYHENVAKFAEACDSLIDCSSLQDVS